jgi:5-formyltetrahydrofolate cyclo-ligase
MSAKNQLRKAFRSHLSALEPDAAALAALNANVVQLLTQIIAKASVTAPANIGQRRFWAAFQPAHHEPDIRAALEQLALAATEVCWVFPKVAGQDLQFYRPFKIDSFERGEWGILEPNPQSSEKVPLHEIQGFLIPALAFDVHGNRLGRGAGYYDRTLADVSLKDKNPIKVGIGFESQLANQALPADDFDVPMDWIVTESRSVETLKHIAADVPATGRRGSVL